MSGELASRDLSARLRRLEDIDAIHRLVGFYASAMDSHDLALVGEIFTEDALFRWEDDHVRAQGRQAIVEMFNGRFARCGFHFTHDRMIELNAADPDVARGIILGHAEVQRDDAHYVAATRYRDVYRREDGCWRIHVRVLQHLYFMPVSEYPTILTRRDRISTPSGRRAAHWPSI